MRKLLIAVIVIAAIWLIHRTNPTFNDHKSAIAPRHSITGPRWNDLKYRDYFLVSFTQSMSKKSMVSYGLCSYVHVADDKWYGKGN